MIIEHLEILLFVTAIGLMMLGFPVAFTLAGTALVFAVLGTWLGVFQWRLMNFMPQRIFGILTNEVLVAAPLFIFMGLMLERSRVAEALLLTMTRLFGGLRGGLALSVVLVGALMAASTGIVGATVVTMGLIALPVMLRQNYDPRLATGVICASGTLGQIIPPSIVLVFLGDIMTYANQQANLKTGRIGASSVGVGDLFAGALIPGLLLAMVYALYVLALAAFRPQLAPPLARAHRDEPLSRANRIEMLVSGLIAPGALIIAVLGSILGGIATPTEAAGVGALGAVLLAGLRVVPGGRFAILSGVVAAIALVILNRSVNLLILRQDFSPLERAMLWLSFALLAVLAAAVAVALWRLARAGVLKPVVQSTARISGMIFAILVGASLFALVFRGLGGEETVHGLLSALPGGLAGAMIFVMLLMFLMGFFLDFLEIIFILVPIVGPALIMLGADPVWLGVMIAINLQTSFLTPPFGFALFFLRGVAPAGVNTGHIYAGIIPFVALQLLMLVVIAAFPALATSLPRVLFD